MKSNKKIIGVDGNEANVSVRVGVNTYAYEVLNHIALLESEWENNIHFRVYLKEKPKPHMPKPTENFSYEVLPGRGLWIIKTLMPALYMKSNKPAVFWSPSHYTPPFAPMPKVCSIMDLGYLMFSEQFRKYDFWQLRLWTAWSLLTSKKVIAISDTTKHDIVRHYRFTREKVNTTLLGYDEDSFKKDTSAADVRRIKEKYSISGKNYILFMSTLKPSKNIEGLLLAWSLIEKDYPDTILVIAGKKGWLFDSIFKRVEQLSLGSRVVFTDFVKEKDKPMLIKGAKLFVLPSLWEGFGIDVVSAMAVGVPVVVSDRGSLPEVAGNAGIIVKPDDASSIANGMQKVLKATKEEYNRLIQEGVKRAKNFSWEKTARETIKILTS